jgi:hypothetical protein
MLVWRGEYAGLRGCFVFGTLDRKEAVAGSCMLAVWQVEPWASVNSDPGLPRKEGSSKYSTVLEEAVDSCNDEEDENNNGSEGAEDS